ncbi:MAG: nuclear transport factor 2 family protein [Hyphomicrobiaceae bacterium]
MHAANTIVVATLLLAVDNLDWPTVERTLAPEVVADYTLLWGGEPERLPSTELVSRWQRLLPGFDATQHLIGPVVVTRADEHSATCATAVRAYHRTS